jgi:malonyl-CoA O-methyltransferase
MDAYRKDKPRVAAAFDQAARDYDEIAAFQRVVAERLLERLDYMRIAPDAILDLGAGTGRAARALARRYTRAEIVESDLALGMLRRQRGFSRWFRRRKAVCADAESLPFGDRSFDLAFSSLMLQWCNDPGRAFAEMRRVLRPGGLFIFSTLGPDTLRELRESWASADDDAHVNVFIDMHDLGDALVRAGLSEPVMETERFTLSYADGHALMRDLKSLGARNANAGRRRTLTGRARLEGMLRAYEKHRRDGRLPATYEVVYGHAWRPASDPGREAGVAVVPVSAIGRRGGRGSGAA